MMNDELRKTWTIALAAGVPGMGAMSIQVGSLMWLRTTINYQYRYGMPMREAMKKLWQEGGVRRFYRGFGPALIQAPTSRFIDTSVNAGMLSLLSENDTMPLGLKTACASVVVGACKMSLMPIDTLKTMMQVEGRNGKQLLKNKVSIYGVRSLYHGSMASGMASAVSHYPWFATYNYLDIYLWKPQTDAGNMERITRSAIMGFCSSFVSDCVANSVRVVKTTRQTSTDARSYIEIVQSLGWRELMTRGLYTKIISNGIQGTCFSVLWRLFQDAYNKK